MQLMSNNKPVQFKVLKELKISIRIPPYKINIHNYFNNCNNEPAIGSGDSNTGDKSDCCDKRVDVINIIMKIK